MDFDILYALQTLHCPFLDALMIGVTTLVGEYGQLTPIVGIILLCFKKTRTCGIAVLVSYILVFLGGQVILKDLLARPRPCQIDEAVKLIVSRPLSYSCPSTHTAFAFGAAMSVFMFFKKWGVAALVAAAVVGFSRMYLFVHFPSDVLVGAVLGVGCALLSVWMVRKMAAKRRAEKEKTA